MEDPIQNVETIDIVGERKDGGLDLCIVVSSKLEDSEHHANLVRQKIQNYVNAIYSNEWQKEYGEHPINIVMKCAELPNQQIIALIAAIKTHLAEFSIVLSVELV